MLAARPSRPDFLPVAKIILKRCAPRVMGAFLLGSMRSGSGGAGALVSLPNQAEGCAPVLCGCSYLEEHFPVGAHISADAYSRLVVQVCMFHVTPCGVLHAAASSVLSLQHACAVGSWSGWLRMLECGRLGGGDGPRLNVP